MSEDNGGAKSPPPSAPPMGDDVANRTAGGEPAVTGVLRRWKMEDLLRRGSLGLRGLALLFSLLSFIIMASNKHGDWKDFDRYEEYRSGSSNSYFFAVWSLNLVANSDSEWLFFLLFMDGLFIGMCWQYRYCRRCTPEAKRCSRSTNCLPGKTCSSAGTPLCLTSSEIRFVSGSRLFYFLSSFCFVCLMDRYEHFRKFVSSERIRVY